MSTEERKQRYEELLAGSLLLDLGADEEAELRELAREFRDHADDDLEWIAAALESGSAERLLEPLPEDLVRKVEMTIPRSRGGRHWFSPVSDLLRSPLTGWAVAAALALAIFLEPGETKRLPDPGMARERLIASDANIVTTRFSGMSDYEPLDGELVWSDTLQEGYMTLANLPPNDPNESQYQLWIVDPERDPDAPVDGGVFDIPPGERAVIPIDAKLAVDHPVAFVITLEHPGGVVKSKQKIVVGVAKPETGITE